MRSRTLSGLIGLFTVGAVVVGMGPAAQAAPGAGAVGKCANKVAPQYLAMNKAPAAAPDVAGAAAEAQLKAKNDPYTGDRAAPSAEHAAKKASTAAQGNPNACTGSSSSTLANATTGPGYGYISWMYHYGQDTSSWCGEATVEVISSTTPGPSRIAIPQSEIAGWLGNGRNTGTSVDQMVAALNHYIGVPDFGWNFYSMVWMNGSPTSAQRSTFLSNVQTDINSFNAPVSGNAYEVAGGHHLVGHPNQLIFHHFAIGGWNTNSSQIWYTDSATTVWSSVPAYSWYDMYNLETILGGRGYVW